MQTRNYHGLRFHPDGTLVDSLDLILNSHRHTLSARYGHAPQEAAWLSSMGMPRREQLTSFSGSLVQNEATLQTYVPHKQVNHERLLRCLPGMREGVVWLHKAGYRLCVATSEICDHAMPELWASGLEGLFDSPASRDEVQRPRPDPESVLPGLASLPVGVEDALMVGDGLHDLEAGRAAGAPRPLQTRTVGGGPPDILGS